MGEQAGRFDAASGVDPLWAVCLIGVGCAERQELVEPAAPEPVEVVGAPAALAGENLAGINLGGANLGGSNLGGTNLGGANLGGTNLGGSNLGGINLGRHQPGWQQPGRHEPGGLEPGGINLGGSNLAGVNLGGINLAASNLGGSNVAGIEPGRQQPGRLEPGRRQPRRLEQRRQHPRRSQRQRHALQRRGLWPPRTAQCVVMGIGSTAFAKLLGQQTANARIYVALGKLPWGFSRPPAAARSRSRAWEAVVWGDQTYCSFVLAAPIGTTWAGVAGFIKAVFRWQAPAHPDDRHQRHRGQRAGTTRPSAPPSTSYPGMMNAASHWRPGKVNEKNFVAGELAFVTATTNNQSVQVDFASWVIDSTSTGLILGDVEGQPADLRRVRLLRVENSDGTVSVRNRRRRLGPDHRVRYLRGPQRRLGHLPGRAPRRQAGARRCGGALYLNYYYGEPVPRASATTT